MPFNWGRFTSMHGYGATFVGLKLTTGLRKERFVWIKPRQVANDCSVRQKKCYSLLRADSWKKGVVAFWNMFQIKKSFHVNRPLNNSIRLRETQEGRPHFHNFTIHRVLFSRSKINIPLTLLQNRKPYTPKVPISWMRTNVIPVFKADAKEKVENCRPISLLSIFAKCQERIVRNAIYS